MSARKDRRVEISKTAAKGIAKLPPHVRGACANIVRKLARGETSGKKLRGELADLRSVRLGQGFRLLYRESGEVIEVVAVGPRGDIYKR